MRKLFFIFLSGLFVSALSAADMVVRVSEEDAGSNCANGGMKIEVGTDDNGNEELDDDEVVAAKTQYVCNGADGSDGTVRLVSVTEVESFYKVFNSVFLKSHMVFFSFLSYIG